MKRARHLLLLCLVVIGSCAGPAKVDDEIVKAPDPVDLIEQWAASELEKGEERLVVRYNPVPCGCPPFELRLSGHWVRLSFTQDVSEERLSVLQELEDKAKKDLDKGAISHYLVAGDVSFSKPSWCNTTVPYLTMTLEAIGPPPPLPVEE